MKKGIKNNSLYLLILLPFGLVIFLIVRFVIIPFMHKENQSSSGKKLKGGRNNPGFLISTASTWIGEVTGINERYESFTRIQDGVRAWLKNYIGHYNTGYTTIEKVIDLLTPKGKENNEIARENYKDFLSKELSMSRTAFIPYAFIPNLAYNIFKFEANKDCDKYTLQTVIDEYKKL